MRPHIELDRETFAANARAWRDFCAPAALYAVVKANGYGWGYARVVPLLEEIADAFCVSDADELFELRRVTRKRAIVMGNVPRDVLADVLNADALPSIETEQDLAMLLRVFDRRKAAPVARIGLRSAAGWSGLTLEGIAGLAPVLAAADAGVSLWTHITDVANIEAQTEAFETARGLLLQAGVRLAESDVSSTFPLAAGCRLGSAVRIGIGLFGSAAGRVPGLRCALRVSAPVTHIETYAAGTRIGYGGTMLSMNERIATARCGYSDGVPKSIERADDILSVGMQYMTARASRLSEDAANVVLVDGATDLDALAAAANRLPHEIVTALGNAAA